ncbi:unnamed protein product [Brassicogethes aeneus]|uniref:Uncharacterized protein n=1 Tax=Brassicogethes aeneus TaxID=1431903 RepID=A0A9P0B5U0_BRAAE|nr:unnamed protein product [Brassicogethes aeneus]
MKLLIITSCLLSLSAAQYYHHATIGHDGHPLETPEVQQAKSHHFAAHAQSLQRAYHPQHYMPQMYGHVHSAHPVDTPEVAAAKIQHHHDFAIAARRNGVYVPHVHQHAGLHQYPVDTPEVQHAKALHFAAHAKARSGLHYRKRRSVYGYSGNHYEVPAIAHDGTPLDTAEVAALKSAHLQAHNEALQRIHHARSQQPHYHNHDDGQYHHHQASPYHQGFSSNHYNNFAPAPAQTYPAYHQNYNGAPVDTPEVQHAKAAHLAAHAKARGFY